MDQTRVIEVKKNILAANDEAADAFRAERAQEGTVFVDVMASPGAGKTTLWPLIRERVCPGRRGPRRHRGRPGIGTVTPSRSRRPRSSPWELNTRCAMWRGMVTMAFRGLLITIVRF